MPARRSGRKLGRDFNLGGEQAEADPFLEDAFYDTGAYAAVRSHDDSHCFLIARTGGGKSALLQHLEEEKREHVIRINPEDLSLPYITDLGVIRYLDSIDVNLDPLFIALWKHIFLVEVIRHRYHVDSPEAKQNFLATLSERIRRDPTKTTALDYLDEFEGQFWCDTDERVREITRKFEQSVDIEAKAQFGIDHLGVGVGAEGTSGWSSESRSEQTERFQRLVNETQLARLNKMMTVLDEDILDSPQNYTYIVVDDLDRDWVDQRLVNDLIRCLFRTVLDLKRIKNLKVLVALRTNLFEDLDFGRRSGGQEEKFRSLVMQLNWTPKDLIRLLDERVHAAGLRFGLDEDSSLATLLPRNGKDGRPMDFILDRTLLRPRDVIAFLNEALRSAEGGARLSWAAIRNAEDRYSNNRLLALRDEWKLSYPGIDKLFSLFTRRNNPLSRTEITNILDDAMLLPADPAFQGVHWMTQVSEPMWRTTLDLGWAETYQPLISLLFRIGFIGMTSSMDGPVTYGHDDNTYADVTSHVDAAEWFVVHPMFQPALDMLPHPHGSGS